jgi:hypothetical protein
LTGKEHAILASGDVGLDRSKYRETGSTVEEVVGLSTAAGDLVILKLERNLKTF